MLTNLAGNNIFSPYKELPEYYERLRSLRGSILVIEGNIGSGKTTLGNKLVKFFNDNDIPAMFYEEHINKPLLELFMADMNKYAFAMQMYMLTCRKQTYIEANTFARLNNGVSIIDRSMYGDYVFANMHYKAGRINDIEWTIYTETINSYKLPQPTHMLFLSVTPEVAMERIKSRNRGSEIKSYSINYLSDLDNTYQEVIKLCDLPVINYDWNQSNNFTDNELYTLCKKL